MSRRPGIAVLSAVLACVGLAACAEEEPTSGAVTIGVAAAPSLSDAFTELIGVFEQQRPEVRVSMELGRSDAIAAGLASRGDINVFASASEEAMRLVVDAGVAAGPRVFARNHVVVAVPSGNPRQVQGLRDLERADLRVGLCALEVPCGKAADSLLTAAGVHPGEVERDAGSRALTARLADNELDVGIIYRTDVASSHGWVAQAEVNSHDRDLAAATGTTRYLLASVPGGAEGPDAEAERAATMEFMELVTSDRGRRAFENAGLAPVTN